ncbi:MAG: hypothetical protein U1B30_10140 [Pseudomonadota bacterium]|nr:hypothetical protein [Pseudomonadota bacterium]
MKQPRTNNRHSRILIVIMTITALLFVQTLLLHTHSPHDHSSQISVLDQHHNQIHIAATDINNHGDELTSEIDLSTKAVAKNIKFSNMLLAVLSLFVILFTPLLVSNRAWLIKRETPFNNFSLLLRPPLRAPPL